jgi:hypothetical protein
MTYTLSEKEIRTIISKIDKKHHLQVYKTLKQIVFSPNVTDKDLKNFEKKLVAIFKRKNLPRLLSEEELEDIINIIPLAPCTLIEIAEDNRRQIKTLIKRQLSKYKLVINDDTIELIKKEILDKFYKSASQAGDSVGVIASMSIGQPLTQANLNTFHNSGAKNSSGEGVKFVERLLNLSSTTKVNEPIRNIIHFKDKNKTKQEIYDLGKKLKGINIEKLIKKNGKTILKQVPEEDNYWYDNYINIFKIDRTIIDNAKVFLRIKLDTDKLYKYDILVSDIIKIIKRTSKVAGFKKTIECIGSSTFDGIIDIYTSEEFARKKIQDFTQKISKGSNLSVAGIEDQIRIFLNKILSSDFKNLYLKGIQGIRNFEISEEINITKTFKEISVINARDLEKFSNKPFNLTLDDMNYLWIIRITKYYIFFVGLNEDKYIKLFEAAGIKIIENNFKDDNAHFTVLLPKDRDVKYFSSETKKSYVRYKKLGNGKYYDNREKKDSNFYSPVRLIQEKLEYIMDVMIYDIDKKLKSELIDDVNLYIEPLYRYAYYYHGIAEGNNIISDLYSIKQIDFSFSYPDNINKINELFGIEAARFNLSSKYNSGSNMQKINPSNIDLIIDFQTAYGYTCSVTANTLARQGNSILTSASFQNSLDYIFRGSAFGEVDKIKGISSCIITGSKCRNGTGIVKSKFDTDYLENEDNKMPEDYIEEEMDILGDYQIEASDIVGPCYKTAVEDKFLDENIYSEEKEENLISSYRIDKYSKGKEEDNIPQPPRMEVPKDVEDLLDLEDIVYGQKEEEGSDDGEEDKIYINLDTPEEEYKDEKDKVYINLDIPEEEYKDEEDKVYMNLDIPDAPEEEYKDEMLF